MVPPDVLELPPEVDDVVPPEVDEVVPPEVDEVVPPLEVDVAPPLEVVVDVVVDDEVVLVDFVLFVVLVDFVLLEQKRKHFELELLLKKRAFASVGVTAATELLATATPTRAAFVILMYCTLTSLFNFNKPNIKRCDTLLEKVKQTPCQKFIKLGFARFAKVNRFTAAQAVVKNFDTV